ncbi:MAG: hypothetical protein H6712_15740 [Myxococcales bacterium]|nr:hypothetical protein [Myxococcales bacterium]MCB9715320.1 hypothetical protein [Myxococcales bacterium]
MRSSRPTAPIGVLVALSLLWVPIACDKGKPAEGEAKAEGGEAKAGGGEAKAEGGEAKADDAAPAEGSGSGAGAEEGDGAAGSGGAAGTGGAGGSEGGAASAEGGDPAGSGGPAAGDSGGEEGGDEGGTTGGGTDTAALLKEVTKTRTKDARALEALAEAEAAGVEVSELAKAANTRGERLYATPDRAKAFFQWANDKDEKYPNAAFNLAKQAAVLGELEEAKTWLTVVHERKGNKLLKQIDFDPMWEILKDDPDVRALLK